MSEIEDLEHELRERRAALVIAESRRHTARAILAPVEHVLAGVKAICWKNQYGVWPSGEEGIWDDRPTGEIPNFERPADAARLMDALKGSWRVEFTDLRIAQADAAEAERRVKQIEGRLDSLNKVPLSQSRLGRSGKERPVLRPKGGKK